MTSPTIEDSSELFKKPSSFLNMYSLIGLEVHDPGLLKYINISRTTLNSGRNHASRIRRLRINVIERFLCGLMRTQKCTGKKTKLFNMLQESFEKLAHQTGENPVQILIRAIENSAPELEQVKVRASGNFRAVEISPSRRLSIALRNLCLGAFRSASSKRPLVDGITEELLFASKGSIQSYGVSKKVERENLAISVK